MTSDNIIVIRRAADRDFLLITQHDHALLSGELAEAFGNELFSPPQPRESVLKGIRLHDCGWPMHDDQPTLNRDGLPLDVFEITRDIALPVWTESADRAAEKDPYAGLLVSLHVLSLSVFATTQQNFEHEKFDVENSAARFAVTKFQHREIERQDNLRMRLGLRTEKHALHRQPQEALQKKEDQLTFNFRMLQAMDVISLAACCTRPPSATTQDVMPQPGGAPMKLALTRRGNDVIVDPWPFGVAEIELKIPATRVPNMKFAKVEDFRAVYASAPAEIITCRVLAG
jgi:hypothetical protein